MTPLRLAGLMALVFVVSLPATFLLHGGPSAWLPSLADPEEGPDKADSDDPVVDMLCLKGLGAMNQGDYPKAIAAYSKAIERDPKYSFAYIGRGDAHLARGDFDRAIADYDRAARVDPGNPVGRERADAARRARALE
jgi:tetratricopeptide (TPR) repeat protein